MDFLDLFLKHCNLPKNFRCNNLNDVSTAMKAFQVTSPYNNLTIFDSSWEDKTFESITRKVLIEKTAGCCIELNSTFNHFLKLNGLDTKLVRVLHSDKNNHENLRHHYFTILKYKNIQYTVDVASGVASPLYPLRIDAQSDSDVVVGLNGLLFRSISNNDGSFLFQGNSSTSINEIKSHCWLNIYHYTLEPVVGYSQLSESQILGGLLHPQFNKGPMLNILTADENLNITGILTLTEKTLTENKPGNEKTKIPIKDNEMYNYYLKTRFNYQKYFQLKPSYYDSLNKRGHFKSKF
ncbi:hypothetical protein CYY_009525 [Polysphondylium violaceum]|uniref:Arylamine N-acetyltransferase n=1 Tax=Polysphondylium violaceum TaxID=133409 RepID=A0A8J4PMQ1_9MYCE|nr:hypothetical protein CYY_009525 [Polysphondylium violaceum]